MIPLARVDERLVHGQVAVAWVPHLGARRVVVADDEAAASPLARAAMTLGLPPDVEGAVVPIAGAGFEALHRAGEVALVLLRGIPQAEQALAAGLTPARCPVLNLGNVHHAPGRRPVTPSVFLSADELEGLRRLAAAGFRVELRTVPQDAPLGLAEIERRWGSG